MDELVTIIIPVYNVERYLDKCVRSVIEQTYTNLEIILVDDGSTDESGKMCDAYSDEDPRIVVVHKQNGGLSSARNAALDLMKGDYVFFLDSDDYIDENLIMYLMNDIRKYNADIAQCNLNGIYESGAEYTDYLGKIDVYSVEDAIKIDLSMKGGSVTACGKLSKKAIFTNLRFPDGKLFEDAYTIIDTLKEARRIVIDNRALYNYVHRRSGITSRPFSKDILENIDAHTRNYNIVKEQFPNALSEALFRKHSAYFFVIDRILQDSNWEENDYFDYVMRYVKSNLMSILSCKYFTIKRKLSTFILLFNPKLYRTIMLKRWQKRLYD